MITNTLSVQQVSGPAKLEPVDRARWDELAASFCDCNYRQLWSYGTLLAQRRGAACERVAIQQGDSVIGIADVRIKKLPVIGGGLAYISGGPLFRREQADDMARLDACIKALVREYVEQRGLTLRILPACGSNAVNLATAEALRANGFEAAEQAAGYRTLLVHIDRPLDEIRASFNGKWRNCLNAAEKKSLTITVGADQARFAQFASMLEATVQRKQFSLDLDPHFYALVQRDLREGEQFIISMVHEGDEVVAANVSGFHGDTAVYLLGAMTEAGMSNKASYLLQWNAIRIAIERGMKWYDLGGIDPEGNPGVYHFKKGLNGDDVATLAFEKSPAGIRAGVTRLAERAYVGVRKLKGGSHK